eukprot:CAMPEP_0206184706 /NCGR_PEP_ID=MMETSP0166-20121206/1376_1 /ASSEMBLY_ACC=CAM_ASM_000260 /TAXON_ID=95228 /ORGANISM="Vannella robusta, Strain DIVA3 518/3/11/1/6" /LENGTH=233 /DNA_ID=CAMNT_0053599769 /DNA_START=21 /DNA_END=719 /DNA_ORIENTATION=-
MTRRPGELGYVKSPKPSVFDAKEKDLKFQIASDIHLEFYNLNQSEDEAKNKEDREELFCKLLTPSAPYLALLGDIGLPANETFGKIYADLLAWCAIHWEEVWVVSGNHEYYKSDNIETEEAISMACKQAGDNVVYMQNTTLIREGVRVCGSSLWSFIPGEVVNIHMRLSDYKHISIREGSAKRALEPKDTHRWHLEHVTWIKEQISEAQESGQPMVVLSHHAPSMNCSEPDIP